MKELASDKEKIKKILYVLFSLFFFISARSGIFSPEIIRGTFIGGVAFLISMETYFSKDEKRNYLNTILPILSVLSALYFIIEFPNIGKRAGLPNNYDI